MPRLRFAARHAERVVAVGIDDLKTLRAEILREKEAVEPGVILLTNVAPDDERARAVERLPFDDAETF